MSEAEIIEKVKRYVADHYDSDWQVCFYAYDGDRDGKLTLAQVTDFLNDAGVGPHWFAAAVGKRIMALVDKNGDKRLSLGELQKAINGE